MVLENEAPLRSIETPSNDPPHTSPSPPHTLFFSPASSFLHKGTVFLLFFFCQDYLRALVIARTSDLKKKSSSKLLGDEDVCHLFLVAGTQGAVGHLPV